ncbi:MAG TPA: hypothetical protein VK573_03105 [Gemmatimonadales bacterium]|nr:hypothetical protein [Gemmatimonadales bacterium]
MTEQPKAPVARPQRPLQADAEGYYEPGYRFTLSGVRFTRLTLRPEPFVTFTRTGTKQEAGCLDAVIRADVVQLRCDVDRVGTVKHRRQVPHPICYDANGHTSPVCGHHGS